MAHDAPKIECETKWAAELTTLHGVAAFARDRAERVEGGDYNPSWIAMQLLQIEHRILACNKTLTGLIGGRVLGLVFDWARLARESQEQRDEANKLLVLYGRAHQLILDRVQWLSTHADDTEVVNIAVIIEHILEAVQGDEGAIASIRVLGVKWEKE